MSYTRSVEPRTIRNQNKQTAIANLSKESHPDDSMIDITCVAGSSVNLNPDEDDINEEDTNSCAVEDVNSVHSQRHSVVHSTQLSDSQSNKDSQLQNHTLKCLICGRGGKLSTVRDQGLKTLMQSSLQRKDQLHVTMNNE